MYPAARQRRERGAIQVRLPVEVKDLALEANAAVLQFLDQCLLFNRSSVGYPHLLPLFFGWLIVEKTFALSAAIRFAPIFYDGASAHNLFNPVGAVQGAVMVVIDIPSPDPEVELVVIGISVAGM